MPLTLNVGLSKKQGLPDYGSVGATCHVTLELESTLLQNDLQAFHRHVKNAYVACSQAVNDELYRQCGGEPNGASHPQQVVASHPPESPPQVPSHSNGNGNGNGTGNGHRASQKQVDYINQLARQVRGLGVRRLESLAERLFGKPLAGLSSFDASSLIDTLKALKDGRLDLEATLNGAETR